MDNLDELLNESGIWHAGERPQKTRLEHVATGFPALDAALPGGGWPLGALTEILHAQTGIGELSLLIPALARLAAHGVGLSRLLLIHPGNATDALWAVEQVLRSGTCAAVLAWSRRADANSLRRLQLAAEAGRSLGLLFRPRARGAKPSPAALRLYLEHREGHALVKLLKCRSARAGQELTVDLPCSGQLAKNLAAAVEPPAADLMQRSAPRPRRSSRAAYSRSDRRNTAQMHLSLVQPLRPPRRWEW